MCASQGPSGHDYVEERVRAVLEKVRAEAAMDKRAGVVQQLGTLKRPILK